MSNNQNEKPKQPVQQAPATKPKPKPITVSLHTFSGQLPKETKNKKNGN